MRSRVAIGLLVLVSLTFVGAACGGDDDDSSSATTTTAPEEARASDADVAAGLHTITGIGDDIAAAVAAGDTTKATDLVEKIEPSWAKIEGTIKSNDEEAYLAFEDAFAAIGLAVKDGDGSKA
ncbi:MAG: hypothetical protein QOD30_1388, partial [Actinomycetota bacterium]|nr:hypothetical protein [Actinomycetota bacterium]